MGDITFELVYLGPAHAPDDMVVVVREDGAILFDFNHPLAGQPVSFEVQIIGVL